MSIQSAATYIAHSEATAEAAIAATRDEAIKRLGGSDGLLSPEPGPSGVVWKREWDDAPPAAPEAPVVPEETAGA